MPESPLVLWVLANPRQPYLRLLDQLPSNVARHVGVTPEAFADAPPPDCVLTCTGRGDLLEAVWSRACSARWIHSLYAGLETTLFPALRASDVPLTNARAVFARSLGEYTMAAVLFFAKELRRLIRQQEEGRWEPFDKLNVAGATLGIIGYGGIGQAAAKRAKAFDMRVLAVRRRPEADPHADEVLPFADVDRVVRESDYLLLCAPLTDETRHVMDAARLAQMKPDAVLINLGRGPLVDEAALVTALRERRIRGAALDVFDVEPLPAGHPFYGLDNVLLSPHSADHYTTWLDEAMELFLDNFGRWTRNEPLRNLADKQAGY